MADAASQTPTRPTASKGQQQQQQQQQQRPLHSRLKKSLAEPLLQYFSPDLNEEPEVLNTPKSVTQHKMKLAEVVASSSPKGAAEKRSRALFKADAEEQQQYENMPPITITDM